MSNQLLASKIVIVEEEPRVRNVAGVPTAVLGVVGVTERGPVGVATLVSSFEEYVNIFGGYTVNGDLAQAMDGFFTNGGTTAWVTRTVHYTDILTPSTKTSAAAQVDLLSDSAAPFGGTVLGTVVGPFDLEPADTLVVDTDAISPTTATFNATAGFRESGNAEPFVLANNEVLTVKVDGAPAQTVTFLTAEFVSIGAATAEEVAAVINAKLSGAKATVTSGGTKVTITSDKRGTSSSIEVTGGSANVGLAFNTAVNNGTGNVANIDAVTVAEVKTIVEAAVAGITVTNDAGRVRITRNTTGAGATVQVDASSTADDELGLDNAVHAGGTGAAVATLRIKGKYDGTYAHGIKARITSATSGTAAEFNLSILLNGLVVEVFPNLTMDDAATNYVETVVNHVTSGSKLVAAVDLDANTGTVLGDRPDGDDTTPVVSAFLSGGNDGLTSLADTDFTGASGANGKTGIRTLDTVQDLSLLAVPGRATSAVHNAMLTYTEVTRDKQVFAVLDPPANQSATGIITYFETTAAVLGLSEFGAAYWPRVKVLNPSKSVFGNSDQITVPPSGHIAGVYSRIDGSRPGGVYVPPAGIENGQLLGVLGFETDEVLEEAKRDLVFPKRINPLTVFPGAPRHIDGARTLKGNGNFPTVAERRGAIFIEQSIKSGLQFARHQNNNENLRNVVARTVQTFLLIQMKNGAFRTNDPNTAFFVDFGDALNPPSVQFAGQLIGRIGIATNKPAEFIVLRFSQDTRALEEELAA
ncbi:MAG: phage tail protein [Chitinophagaceae bacterium]|nr:MAG: phage tail protein [Chitinophagaceae bacterium]